jgi:hypothetical protein
LGIALPAGILRLGFIFLLPGKIFLNISGEKSEENAEHEGVVNDADPRESLRDEIEGIRQIEETQKTTHESAGGELAVASREEVSEHGWGGANQSGEIGPLGAGAKRVHVSLTMLHYRSGNEEFDED